MHRVWSTNREFAPCAGLESDKTGYFPASRELPRALLRPKYDLPARLVGKKLNRRNSPFWHYRHYPRLSSNYLSLLRVVRRCQAMSGIVQPLCARCLPSIRHYRHCEHCLGVVGGLLPFRTRLSNAFIRYEEVMRYRLSAQQSASADSFHDDMYTHEVRPLDGGVIHELLFASSASWEFECRTFCVEDQLR